MTMPVPKTPELDQNRKAMMEAARAYDEVQRELASLRDQLHTAVAGLEAKNSEIEELKKVFAKLSAQYDTMMSEERANVAIANEARDRAYAERADALSWLANIELIIERAKEGGLPARPNKRNGKAAAAPGPAAAAAGPDAVAAALDVGPLPDQAGGEAEVR